MSDDETDEESFEQWLFYARKDRRSKRTMHTTTSSTTNNADTGN
ncbi:hypothetical protein ACTXJ9_14085 [Brachybacterium tyrofermentans]